MARTTDERGHPRLREIIESSEFQNALMEFDDPYRRLDDLLEPYVVAIASHPDAFPEVPGTGLRRLQIETAEGPVNVTFRFSGEQVVLVGALRVANGGQTDEPPAHERPVRLIEESCREG